MHKLLMSCAVIGLSLTGCATLSSVPPALSGPAMPANLAACPPWDRVDPATYGQLADAYVDALAWGADCRRRAQGLEAAWPR